MTLLEFLLARITEDEENAPTPSWTDSDGRCMDCGGPGEARVLAECEAKRRIIEAWQREDDDDSVAANEVAAEKRVSRQVTLWAVLKELAKPYAGHPDYAPDKWWRP